MSTETTEAIEDAPIDPPPPPALEANGAANVAAPPPRQQTKVKRVEPSGDKAPAGSAGGGESAPIRQYRITEDMNLRDIMANLGTSGTFKIQVFRVEPKEFRDPNTGRMVLTSGMLESYQEEIDEEFIKQKHGGGTFDVRFQKRERDVGPYKFVGQRRIVIAGDPRLDDIPRNIGKDMPAAPAVVAAPAADAPSVITKVIDMVERQAERQREHASPAQPDYAAITQPLQTMIAALQTQLEKANAAAATREAHLMQQIAELSKARPEDPFRDKMLNNLMDGETARINGLRATHESEIRTLKENAREDEKRLRDAHERDKQQLIASFDRERQTMIASHAVALESAKAGFNAENKSHEGQIRALERENAALRDEVKELRAKKDKSIIDQVKELEVIKDALGLDDDKETSIASQIAEAATNPEIIGSIGKIFGRGGTPATGNQPTQQQQPAGPPPGGYRRQIVKSPDGRAWLLMPNGELHGPLEKKDKAKQASAPSVPVIAPEQVQMAVSFLERAVQGGQDPETVAQGARTLVPDEIIQAIRDLGVDGFMQKVAKVPGSSPLANQEGRNWVRKFGKALVGG